jgi:Domain of unknown function (DUF4352)
MSTLFSRRLFLLAMLLLIVCGILAACAGPFNSTATASPTPTVNDETIPTPVAQSQEVQTGAPADVEGKFIITVKKPKMSSGDASIKPQNANNQFLIFTVAVKNISKQEQSVPGSTLFILTDSSGKKYDQVSDPGAGTALQGTVKVGNLVNGVLVFEVPKSTHTFTVSLQLTSKSQLVTIWDVKV